MDVSQPCCPLVKPMVTVIKGHVLEVLDELHDEEGVEELVFAEIPPTVL